MKIEVLNRQQNSVVMTFESFDSVLKKEFMHICIKECVEKPSVRPYRTVYFNNNSIIGTDQGFEVFANGRVEGRFDFSEEGYKSFFEKYFN